MDFDNITVHMLVYPDQEMHMDYSRAYRTDGNISYHEAFGRGSITRIITQRWQPNQRARRIRLWAPKDPTAMFASVRRRGYTRYPYDRLSDDIVATEG